jgi:hypothetical protein
MSKFLSGRQSNLKLGVAGYTESKTVLETTGKVGIGTTDAQQHSLFVVGSTNITGDTTVGSAITMYASSGIVSATAFYGDGSNLENTGATLSAAAGTQRLVVTSLTSGTMVDAATDSDLTYNATTDTLNVENIDVDGHTELDQLRVTGVSTFAGNVDISSNGNLTVAGNLIVQGTETRLNTTVLEVEDINIGIASVTPTLSDAALDGAGITIHGSQGDKTLTWSNANSRMEFNTDVNVVNLKLDDNQKATFGDGDDLKIFHNGSASLIRHTGTGNLFISNAADDQDVIIQSDDGSGGESTYFRADGSTGEAVLYHYGSQKFATKSDGIDVTGHTETDTLRVSGVSTFQGNVHLPDNVTLNIGTGNDLQIFYNGNNSRLIDSSGQLVYRSQSHKFRNQAGTENLAAFAANGAVELYYDNSKKFETTGIGVSVYDHLNVGTGVTIYGNAGIVSAISFYGDGSNLTNTGATLSATSGTERLVTTQLTSGTMVDAATDADLTFNAANNLLHTPKIDAAGLSPDGTNFGVSGYVPLADGAGGWSWANLQGASSVNTILNGFTVSEEGNVVGTAGSITQLDFRGVNVLASADPQPNGIATVSILLNQSLDSLDVSGISTFGGQISVGGTTGTDGQYLRSTGVGVTWADFPTLRTTHTEIANVGVTTFNFNYNADFLDVFVNGVKLTPTEYTASNGSTVTLATPTFQDDVIELVSYNVVSTYQAGAGSTTGVSDGDKGDIIVSGSGTNWQIDANTIGPNELVNTSVTPGTYNFATLTVDADGRLTAASSGTETPESFTAVGIQSGGTLVGTAKTINFANNLTATVTDGVAEIISTGGGSSVSISTVAPGSPLSGDLWWRSTDGRAFIYYPDGSSNQWVEFSHGGGTIGINTAGTSTFNVISANTYQGITTSMISDYGNGISVSGTNVEISSNPPSNPSEGDLWWDSDVAKGYIYYTDGNSNQWVEFNPAGGGSGSGGSSYTDSDVDAHLNTSTASTGEVLSWNGSDYDWVSNAGGGSIAGISTTGISYFNNINASGTITANSFSGITTSMISDYGNGLSSGGSTFASRSANAYTATAGQTTFASTYTVGYVDVYLNGSKLTGDQYTATNGSTIVLLEGASLGDIVEVIGLQTTASSPVTRNAETLTIGSIASGITTTGTITLPKTGVMISIHPVGDASGWLRLYTRSDLADADASRARTQDPNPGSGVILETITSGISTVYLSPQTIFASAEDTPINTFNYRFTKDGTAGITTFTFKYLSLEP